MVTMNISVVKMFTLFCQIIFVTLRILKVRMGHFVINFLEGYNLFGASLSEPHTNETFMLSTIHKKLRIKIRKLTTPSILILSV